MYPTVACAASARGFVGLPPYRDSITQLIVHSLYQSLLLHHQHQRGNGRGKQGDIFEVTAVEMECRLGQFTPKNQRKLHQQDWLVNAGGRGGIGSGSGQSMRNSDGGDARNSFHIGVSSVPALATNVLTTFPVATPAVLHQKAQYQCRFDVGVSSPSLQRLEYLLQIPHRRPPHVIPRGEAPLVGVKSQLLPSCIVVHENDSSRYQFVVEKQSGERVVRFNCSQTKSLAYQSDVICPHWNSDMRLSVALEKTRRHLATTSNTGSSETSTEMASGIASQTSGREWGDRISALFFHSHRSRTAVGRYFWVDIAAVQTLPHSSAFLQHTSGVTSTSGGGLSMRRQLSELLQRPGYTCRLEAFRGLSLALMNRSRIRKVELEINISQLYADWTSLARFRHLHSLHRFTPSLQRTARRSRHGSPVGRREKVDLGEINHRRLPPIPRNIYAREVLEALQLGTNGHISSFYPTFFEMDIHRPIEFGGIGGRNDEMMKNVEETFLYGVAQQLLTLMQFLGAGAQS